MAGPSRSSSPRGPLGRTLHWLLGVRLFYKVLLANAAIAGAGTILGAVAAAEFARRGEAESLVPVIGALALAGVLLSLAANAIILRFALRPLKRLEQTAAAVRGGDLRARSPLSALADRDLARLVTTFNDMLDRLLLYRERLRTMIVRAMESAEDERKRISRELHDDTAQTLANLIIRLRAARAASDEGERERRFDELRAELADAAERVRRFARGLRPPALDMLGLVPAIEAHARSVEESTGLEVEFGADPIDGLLSEQAELGLYRIIQEALSNVVRHADAERAVVSIRREKDRLTASVRDDGRGFSPADVESHPDRGLGLFGMRERASYFGGTVDIHGEPGKGSSIRVELPLTAPETLGNA